MNRQDAKDAKEEREKKKRKWPRHALCSWSFSFFLSLLFSLSFLGVLGVLAVHSVSGPSGEISCRRHRAKDVAIGINEEPLRRTVGRERERGDALGLAVRVDEVHLPRQAGNGY